MGNRKDGEMVRRYAHLAADHLAVYAARLEDHGPTAGAVVSRGTNVARLSDVLVQREANSAKTKHPGAPSAAQPSDFLCGGRALVDPLSVSAYRRHTDYQSSSLVLDLWEHGILQRTIALSAVEAEQVNNGRIYCKHECTEERADRCLYSESCPDQAHD